MEVWQAVAAAVTVGVALVGIGIWVGAVNGDRAAFKTFMDEVRRDIKEILQRLPPVAVTRDSPLRLTELGLGISEELGAQTIAEELARGLRERAQDLPAYDVQEMCFTYIQDEYSPPIEVDAMIKECAYNHGVDREQVLRVIAVELRDLLLGVTGQSPSPVKE